MLAVLFVLLCCGLLAADDQPIAYQAKSVTFALANPPQQVPNASVARTGNPGRRTLYYWIVTHGAAGASTPAGPFVIPQAPDALSVSNYITVSWAPAVGATSYDVLRTLTPTPPRGACNCAVATAVTATDANDQAEALGAYTVAPLDPAGLAVTLTNVNGALTLPASNGLNIQGLSAGCMTIGADGAVASTGFACGTGSGYAGVSEDGADGILVAGNVATNALTGTGTTAGQLELAAGAANSMPSSSIAIAAPASVPSAYRVTLPTTAPDGYPKYTNSGGEVSISYSPVVLDVFSRRFQWTTPVNLAPYYLSWGTGDAKTGTLSYITPSSTLPVVSQVQSAATTGSAAMMAQGTATFTAKNPILRWVVYFPNSSDLTGVRLWIGAVTDYGSPATSYNNDDPASYHISFRLASGGTNWFCGAHGASASTWVDSGVAAAANTVYKFEIRATATSARYFINGSQVCSISTNLPLGNVLLYPMILSIAQEAAAKNVRFAVIYKEEDM